MCFICWVKHISNNNFSGTLKPIAEFEALLKVLNKDQIMHFEAKHVVPSENIFLRTLDVDTSGNLIKFNYECNKNIETAKIIWEIITEIASIFKPNSTKTVYDGKGIIIFLQNYACLSKIESYYQSNKSLLNETIDTKILVKT